MKKRIFIFDIDNTIFEQKKQRIPDDTRNLLIEIANNKNYILGIATGRGPSKLDIIEEIKDLIKFKILVNGAILYIEDELIHNIPIKRSDVEQLVNKASKMNICMGLVGKDKEVVTSSDLRILEEIRGNNSRNLPVVDKDFYLSNDIYQLWMLNYDKNSIDEFQKEFNQFRTFYWHSGGADFIYPFINKGACIKELRTKYIGYEVIAVGDGMNDIEMIMSADIGIAMDNTNNEELRKNAKFIAPNIKDYKLHEFFKEKELI